MKLSENSLSKELNDPACRQGSIDQDRLFTIIPQSESDVHRRTPEENMEITEEREYAETLASEKKCLDRSTFAD